MFAWLVSGQITLVQSLTVHSPSYPQSFSPSSDVTSLLRTFLKLKKCVYLHVSSCLTRVGNTGVATQKHHMVPKSQPEIVQTPATLHPWSLTLLGGQHRGNPWGESTPNVWEIEPRGNSQPCLLRTLDRMPTPCLVTSWCDIQYFSWAEPANLCFHCTCFITLLLQLSWISLLFKPPCQRVDGSNEIGNQR